MDSYMEPLFDSNLNNQHEQHNSGLLRFRSAPSSMFNEFMTQTRSGDDLFELKPQTLSSTNGYLGPGRLPPQYTKQLMGCSSNSGSSSTAIQRSNSLEIDGQGNGGGGGCNGLNLSRQSSSPAGFFDHLNPQNVMSGRGNFGVGNGTNSESSGHLSRLSMHHLPQIPEITNENIKETSPHDDDVIKFPFTSWNDSGSDSSHLSENGGLATRSNLLRHHLSLPKTSAEMAAVEKLFHFQDTVPCKVRAKRGCATHPRSIAERVRRNRISERMRKLTELVPNMDKQTNTADMLDLAVEYIKNLQNHHQVLSNNRAKCKCVNLQQH